MRKWSVGAVVALTAVVAGTAGFAGARALSAAEARSNYEADAQEIDRTERSLHASLHTGVERIKRIAAETTVENAEANKAQRDVQILSALKESQEDAMVLMIQAHLLCLDHMADTGGEIVEQFLQSGIYDKLGVAPQDVARRKMETGLGHGSLVIGYKIAQITKKPADEIFRAKQDRSWIEVMRARGVTPGQLQLAMEDKK